MKEVTILSGKGGTGKTSVTASLASLAKNKVMVDCDVDAADLYLLLEPTSRQKQEFRSGEKAVISAEKCTGCGLCREVCRFEAISSEYKVDPVSCDGCRFCYNICPADAITMQQSLSGHWFSSETRYGPLVHARLGVAQENSGKLVALVRQEAKHIAEQRGLDFIISDGPPGTGCPVISSLSGVSLAVIVTEPTLSGIHDLKRVIGVCQHFAVPVIVCINKYDINSENSHQIEDYCRTQGIGIAARIPFDTLVTRALVKRIPVVEYSRNRVGREIEKLWQVVTGYLN
ncbi:MAG: ATP-binding protein [Dehalococcoidales bacterium]|nr:ATP-binding protein [Dehalococcoidales bacterium]